MGLLACVMLLVAACQSLPLPARPPREPTASIFIVRRAWHIDIGFASADLQPPLRSLLNEFPPATYLEFGFGDRHYLLTRDHGTSTLLRALWPGPGLVLMTALRATPQEAFGAANVIELRLAEDRAHDLQMFVWRSMSRGDAPLQPVAAGPYAGSVFYDAIPSYSGLHTCNTWAAQALRAAGLPVHTTGVAFAGQVWSQVRRIARLEGASP